MAEPEIHEALEKRCVKYAIRTPGNASFGYVTGTVGSGSGISGVGGGRALQLGARLSV